MIKRKPLRAWCGAIAATLLSFAALAATPQEVNQAALDQDQAIQKLKEQSLQVIQEAQGVEQDFLYPGYNRLAVYVGVRITAMILRDISISIDDGKPVTYEYPRSESVELQLLGNSLHRVIVMNAPTGRHHIHAQFTAQYAEARPTDPPYTGSYDGYFDKTEQPADIELSLQRQGYLTRPELKFYQWSVAQ